MPGLEDSLFIVLHDSLDFGKVTPAEASIGR